MWTLKGFILLAMNKYLQALLAFKKVLALDSKAISAASGKKRISKIHTLLKNKGELGNLIRDQVSQAKSEEMYEETHGSFIFQTKIKNHQSIGDR